MVKNPHFQIVTMLDSIHKFCSSTVVSMQTNNAHFLQYYLREAIQMYDTNIITMVNNYKGDRYPIQAINSGESIASFYRSHAIAFFHDTTSYLVGMPSTATHLRCLEKGLSQLLLHEVLT